MKITDGAKFGIYEIISKIGEGGMGEVYLAEDTRLFRKVAIKILPSESAGHDRMRRFEQEARAASALNHPNILTIYEIGDVEGIRFIATEYVEGATLRDALHSAHHELPELIEYGIQIASALSAAHEANIVHRDIKPENVMIRRDGLIKVLDFGLAKLSSTPVNIDSESETRAQVKTEPGLIMGTVRYMAPEQARGKGVDARSDIWSLGCVIYEMVAGRPPFDGDNTADLIAEIVKMNPVPLTDLAPQIPDRLDEIVSKTLEKNADERYQTVKDLLIDLRRLKKKLDSQIVVDRTPGAERRSIASGFSVTNQTQSVAGVDTRSGGAPTVSSAEYIVDNLSRHKGIAAAAALVVIAVLGGLFYFAYRAASDRPPEPAGKDMKIARLTTSGDAGAVSISGDGKYIVHSSGNVEGRGLWVRQTNVESAVQIVPSARGRFSGTAFSPGSDHIYYTWQPEGSSFGGTLYEIATLGGTPRLIIRDVGGPVTFSPDGKSIAFIRRESQLIIADADGGNERQVAKNASNSQWFANDGASWSPDGRSIVFARGDSAGGRLAMTLVSVPVESGEAIPFTDQKWTGPVHRAVWMPDGSGVVVNATNNLVTGSQVWFLPYPKAPARRVTNDLNGYGTFSLGITNDGSTIATVQEDTSFQVWTGAEGDDESRAKQLNTGKYDGGNIAWAPDGRIVFVRLSGESSDIWIMNADGTGQRQLTKDAAFEDRLAVSSDGRYIIYTSDRSGLLHIWRMNIDGTDPRELSTDPDFDEGNPRITPDGQWVVFNSWRTGKNGPWKVSIDGGEPQLLFDRQATVGPISPDGRYVLCSYLDEDVAPPKPKAALVPLQAGEPVTFRDLSGFVFPDASWIGDTIFVVRGNPGNVFSIPAAGGQFKQLTNFKSKIMFRMATQDGKRFLLSRGETTDDVVLIKDFH